ncbi:hypothetical protein ACVME8_009211 [Bradyrhizobium diazoefficiens]
MRRAARATPSFRGVAQQRARNPSTRSLCRPMDSGLAPVGAPRNDRRDARSCFNLVIASVAKQSRIIPRRDSGFLRCARNDGEMAAHRACHPSCHSASVLPDGSNAGVAEKNSTPSTPFYCAWGCFRLFYRSGPPQKKPTASPPRPAAPSAPSSTPASSRTAAPPRRTRARTAPRGRSRPACPRTR